ncbi:isoleucine--tRNA ligase [Mycoplasmoides genitalium]
MDLKKTLLMPKTSFAMQANLSTSEKNFHDFWKDKKVFQKLKKQNKGKQIKILHDGPPYANGSIHVGHALNKILKDFILRSWLYEGYDVVFIPGWDCHGLPIEHAVSKKNPSSYSNLSTVEKRKLCHQFALSQIAVQKEQFQRLGLLNDFQNCYYTIDESFQFKELELFLQAIKKGLIFQDLKPTYWSPISRTSLAEAEIEYKEVNSIALYLTFKVSKSDFLDENANLLVWTTTPWTLPTNQAIAIHPDFDYLLFEYNQQKFVILEKLFEVFTNKLNWTNAIKLKKFKGSNLKNSSYSHCFYNKVLPVLMGIHVVDNEGTGIVHSSPAFGIDDFYLCQKNKIKEVLISIDEKGVFNNLLNDKELENCFYLKANDLIINRLKQNNSFIFSEVISHREPHDWRSKTPVIYRASKQLFIKTKSIKKQLKKQINQVNFLNSKNQLRLKEMLLQRDEWCISRQRVWGLPIPIVYANNKPLLDFSTIQYTIKQLKKHGIDSWFEKDVTCFLKPDKTKKWVKYHKEIDTLDVWFDSGSSYNVLEINKYGSIADLYIEGSDQYRGWFNSSSNCGIIQNDLIPFKSLVSHGFTLDENGNKMSKSLGNIVDPLKICDQYGADILRLWVANTDWQIDNKIGVNIIKQVAEQYRRIRNSLLRFILGNINGFNFTSMDDYKFSLEDKIVIHKTNSLVEQIEKFLEKYNFLGCLKVINKFVLWLSSWYFEIIKDTLYCDAKNNPNRLAKQAVLNYIFTQLISFLNIFIPHTAEDAWKNYSFNKKPISVNLFTKPTVFKVANSKNLENIYKTFTSIKNAAFKEIEKLRKEGLISKNNQIELTVGINKKIPKKLKDNLALWLNVNSVNLTNNENEIKVKKTKKTMCERCWNFQTIIKQKLDHNLCSRCFKVC